MLQRTLITFCGRTNTGKSLLVNRITSQDMSIVSDISGTTTDPVKKTMELLPLGPVTIIDTPGIDDTSKLAKDRIQKTFDALGKTDIAILVADAASGICEYEETLIKLFKEKNIPYITVFNKCDLIQDSKNNSCATDITFTPADTTTQSSSIFVSALTGTNCNLLKEKISLLTEYTAKTRNRALVSDLVKPGSQVILVMPIDEGAPKDRIILPQQQVIRDLLNINAIPVCCTPDSLKQTLTSLKNKPALVITDSQAFKQVNSILPQEIPLTSFSILMSRFKGTLSTSLEGIKALTTLKDGDKILISEGCTHHRQCKDIGTVKLPSWINSFCNKKFDYDFSSGNSFTNDIAQYKLVIHCGGCMLNEKEMQSRIELCKACSVPVTNYGMIIAHINGILERSLAPLTI
ncbi:[FeFe] hydrogenase H-cluster maturation GTPase HydF [Treponema sp.]|uniref:[FeFe] hydrogenase H-cluster maturation GTPase HydF n=1 Tax=Treponema sp. TaxID=166 RepID=UPI00298E8150|nr:[FeFe] hydrogenase H-cluster maturation GTPase HydF [Treponema sp.]MCR5613001.1 [FeFe] hydrogenase H-cluster maturation GTPase HydF [Treponema sp.]